jgi:hypothetical protein
MSLEKDHQAECYRTLKAFGGFAHKLVQDTVVCTNCYHPVHPKNKGWPDYHGEILLNTGLYMPVKVECKAGEERFNFNQITDEQIEFLKEYKGISFLWLQLGMKMVATSDFLARRVWMIPVQTYFEKVEYIREKHNVQYIPLSHEVALQFNMRFKEQADTALQLFAQYEMEWIGGKGNQFWRPNPLHPIWDYNPEVTYDKFHLARQSNT